MRHFYPRSPCGERLGCQRGSGSALSISIHALLAESDFIQNQIIFHHNLFLSTLSLRRATYDHVASCQAKSISIHALLAESDRQRFLGQLHRNHFYPRSPCGERPDCPSITVLHCNFYPRSPCGERPPYNLMIHHEKNISIHALLAESDNGPGPFGPARIISIHALLAESDFIKQHIFTNHSLFLSTLSLRRATRKTFA